MSRSLTGHRSNCLTIEFHPFGPMLASGSLDTNVKVWDLRRKEAITTFKGHTKGVKKLAISPDGKWVCSGSENGEVKVSNPAGWRWQGAGAVAAPCMPCAAEQCDVRLRPHALLRCLVLRVCRPPPLLLAAACSCGMRRWGAW